MDTSCGTAVIYLPIYTDRNDETAPAVLILKITFTKSYQSYGSVNLKRLTCISVWITTLIKYISFK